MVDDGVLARVDLIDCEESDTPFFKFLRDKTMDQKRLE